MSEEQESCSVRYDSFKAIHEHYSLVVRQSIRNSRTDSVKSSLSTLAIFSPSKFDQKLDINEMIR